MHRDFPPRIYGRLVLLVPPDPADFDHITDLRNRNREWFFDNRTITNEASREWLRSHAGIHDDGLMVIRWAETAKFIGVIGWSHWNPVSSTVDLGRIILDKKALPDLLPHIRDGYEGITLDASRALIDFWFCKAGAQQVSARCLSQNNLALRLCKSLGMQEAAKSRITRGTGDTTDSTVLILTHEEWLRRSGRPLRVAFFTHHFLEPTHHAIAAMLRSTRETRFTVFARKRYDTTAFQLRNVDAVYSPDTGDFERLYPDFDLVHAVYDGRTALRAARRALAAKLPFILSFHGGFDTNAKIFDNRYREWTRKVAEFATVVTVVSHRDVRQLRKIGIERHIDVLPVPVDDELPAPPSARSPLDLIAIGRLVEKKGFDVLLRALAKLPKQFRILIIGDGPERERLQALCDELMLRERVTWAGELAYTATLAQLNAAGILVHPARVAKNGNSEGTPQAVLLAQALRVPVITTRSGSLEEIVSSGETGWLVSPDNPEELARAIEIVAAGGEIIEKIRNAAAEATRSRHSLERVADHLRILYRGAFMKTWEPSELAPPGHRPEG